MLNEPWNKIRSSECQQHRLIFPLRWLICPHHNVSPSAVSFLSLSLRSAMRIPDWDVSRSYYTLYLFKSHRIGFCYLRVICSFAHVANAKIVNWNYNCFNVLRKKLNVGLFDSSSDAKNLKHRNGSDGEGRGTRIEASSQTPISTASNIPRFCWTSIYL